MAVRRTWRASPRLRTALRTALSGATVLLLASSLAGCTDEVRTQKTSAGTKDTTAASPPASASPLPETPSAQPEPVPDVLPDAVAQVRPPLVAQTAPPLPLKPVTPEGAGAHVHEPSPGKPSDKPKVLAGGGLASAVPGSDAPNRKVDVGPQFAISDDVDIAEIERLVAAVEKIAKQQRLDTPLGTGDSVQAAVGTFSYRWFADGTVEPDPAWVRANIRTEAVPILGSVTGHRVLFPQLRGALQEIVARGLADEINPEEFGGCYVPRFIARDPSKGLSLHSWGIAVDLNVPTNQRGVAGDIDRTVVAIFKKWGFAWGGDWAYTDPMHFELNRIVRAR